MANNGLNVRVRVEGLREVERAAARVGPQAKVLLGTKTMEIAEKLAATVRTAARADSRQSALMAPTVKPVRGAQPAVTAGGTTPVGRNRKPAFKILFGSEFGAHRYRQFRPHRGASSYWFFRTVEAEQPRVDREWQGMADELVRRWSA